MHAKVEDMLSKLKEISAMRKSNTGVAFSVTIMATAPHHHCRRLKGNSNLTTWAHFEETSHMCFAKWSTHSVA